MMDSFSVMSDSTTVSRSALFTEYTACEEEIRRLWTKSEERLHEAAGYVGAFVEYLQYETRGERSGVPPADDLEYLHRLLAEKGLPKLWGADAAPVCDLSEAEVFTAFAWDQAKAARGFLSDRAEKDVGIQTALEWGSAALATASRAIAWAYGLTPRH